MTREEIFNKIINGLYSCKDEYGEGLDVHFNSNQLRDFANTLTSFFPDNLEYKLTLLEKEIFDNIPDKEEMLFQLFRFHLLSVYTNLFNNSIYKEKGIKSLYQIFFLSGRFLNKEGEDIDMLFHKMIGFYNSFKINNFELRREIEANNVENAVTIGINQEESIRIISDLDRLELIPTNKTRTIFKYLL
jgi:hypothetical protein